MPDPVFVTIPPEEPVKIATAVTQGQVHKVKAIKNMFHTYKVNNDKSVAAEDDTPTGVSFNDTGTKMYVIGRENNLVYEYDLSTAWDPDTAVYNAVNLDVDPEDTFPTDIFFKPDGTKMFMVGTTGDKVYAYTLSTPWDLSTATYDTVSFDLSTEDTQPTSVFFKADGSTMWMVGRTTDTVYQYTLGTPWLVSSASVDAASLSVITQDSDPTSIFFKPDGLALYMVGTSTDKIYQYDLTVAFDLTTASYSDISFSLARDDTFPTDIFFKADGTKLYTTGTQNSKVYQYDFDTTAWDLTDISPVETDFRGVPMFFEEGSRLSMLISATEPIDVYVWLEGSDSGELRVDV